MMGKEFRILIACAVALCACSLAQGQLMSLSVDFTPSSYTVPDKLVKIGDIGRGTGQFELANMDSVMHTVYLKVYFSTMAGNVDIQTSAMLVVDAGQTMDVSDTINNMGVNVLSAACDQDTNYELMVDILDSNMVAVLNTYPISMIKLICDTKDVHVSFFCPFAVGIDPGRRYNFSDVCNGTMSVKVNGPYGLPGDGWTVSVGNMTRGLNHITFDQSMPADITVQVAGLEVEVPPRGCDNKDVQLNFTFGDGILEATGYVEVIALCSYAGLNMNIAPGTVSGPFNVADGNLFFAVQDLDFSVEKTGQIPDLVYTDMNDQVMPGKFFATMFVTDRDAGELDPSMCSDDWHIMEPMPWDIIVSTVAFDSGSDLAELRWNLLNKLDGKQFNNVCGTKTLVVLLDSIKSMTNENPCDNYLTYVVNFDCDPANAPNATMSTILNPYSEEFALIYRSENGTRTYMVTVADQGTQFKPINPMYGFDADRNGYGRLNIIQEYLKESVPSKCASADAKELVDEMEGWKTGAGIVSPDVNVSSISIVNYYMEQLKDMKNNGQDMSSKAMELAAEHNSALSSVRDDYDSAVLDGAFEALTDFATGNNQTSFGSPMCDTVMSIESMKIAPYQDADLLRRVAYMWVNTTLNNDFVCTKAILAGMVDLNRNVMKTNYNPTKVTSFLSDSPDKGPLGCYSNSPCMKQLITECNLKLMDKEEKPASDDKMTICMSYEMKKFFKEQGNAMLFKDIRSDEASKMDFDPTGCLSSNKVKIENGPTKFMKEEDGILKSGIVAMDTSKVAWRNVAVMDCQVCNNQGYGSGWGSGSGWSTYPWSGSGSGWSGSGSGWTTNSWSGSGSGWSGSGSGMTTNNWYGSGSGSGSGMTTNNWSGSGSGSGMTTNTWSGSGSGSGSGMTTNNWSGSGSGSGMTTNNWSGSGSGSGMTTNNWSGSGSGSGSGMTTNNWSGSGSGSGSGMTTNSWSGSGSGSGMTTNSWSGSGSGFGMTTNAWSGFGKK